MNRSDYYSNLENVLQFINRKYISLPAVEVTRNTAIVESVLNVFTDELKKDPLFKALYTTVFYGGSFYDGLRVGKPDEFDLDLLLRLDKAQPRITITNIPGFVQCQLGNPSAISGLEKWVDGKGYIKNDKVRRWMEGLMTRAVRKLCPHVACEQRNVPGTQAQEEVYMRKSGPAVTLVLSSFDTSTDIDIDFVPCFMFDGRQWPVGGYRANTSSSRPNFFIVPKMPANNQLPCDNTILWRLSFQEQEREIIEGKQFLKPAVKLLKKFRDVHQHNKVASYYIKTIFLWEATEPNSVLLNNSTTLTQTFLIMFEKYIEWLDRGEIPYFWNRRHNLLGASPTTLQNFANCLRYIHRDITNHMDDPYRICKHLRIPVYEAESAVMASQNEEGASRCIIL